MRKTGILFLLVIVMLSGCGKKDENVIRVGSNRALGSITPYVAEEMGLFEDQDAKVEVIEFGDGATLMEAMSAGELDMAICGVTPAAIWNAKGINIRVIASANAGGHVLLSKKEDNISSVEDLIGKKLATPNVGTVTDTILRSYILKNKGINPDDITIITGMKPADMSTALMVSGEVDAIMTWEPFASEAMAKYDNAMIMYDVAAEIKEDTGAEHLYPVNVLIVSEKFRTEHQDSLQKTFEALVAATEYINEKPDEANQTIATLLSLDTNTVAAARERVEFTCELDLDATYDTLQWAYELGYLEEMPKQEEFFDMSYLEGIEE